MSPLMSHNYNSYNTSNGGHQSKNNQSEKAITLKVGFKKFAFGDRLLVQMLVSITQLAWTNANPAF